MKFYIEILQITSLKPSIYRLTENLILLKIGLWQVGVQKVTYPRPDGLLRPPFQNSAILLKTGPRPDGLAEHQECLHCHFFPHL
jgi:hypothetical protein